MLLLQEYIVLMLLFQVCVSFLLLSRISHFIPAIALDFCPADIITPDFVPQKLTVSEIYSYSEGKSTSVYSRPMAGRNLSKMSEVFNFRLEVLMQG